MACAIFPLGYTLHMDEHYICTGGCEGVSPVPGTCQATDCAKHEHALELCTCEDGEHNGFVSKDKEEADV